MWLLGENDLREADEGVSFLASRWREMFGKYTPDSYRPRLMDLPSLLAELGDVAALSREDPRWTPHRRMVIEELQAAAESDPVLSACAPRAAAAIAQLSPDAKADTAATVAKHCADWTSGYLDWIVSELQRIVESAPAKIREKKRADILLGVLGTRALQQGLGRQYCESLVADEVLRLDAGELLEKIIGG